MGVSHEPLKDQVMFDHKPREHEWISWLLVAAWTTAILGSVPSIRLLTDTVQSHWGGATFTYAVSLLVIAGGAATLAFLIKRGGAPPARFAWLAAILGVYVYLTFDLRSRWPVEAFHYVEYGILSVLIYRALSHRIGDTSIYVACVLAGTLIGVLDECVQWLVPGRYFDFRDIELNFFAVALAQIAIASAIRPKNISGWPTARSWQRLSHLGAALVLALGLCHLNTPDTIAAYTAQIPALSFIRNGGDVMVDYGHLYDAPETGRFRSRFTAAQLRQLDQSRSQALTGLPIDFANPEASFRFLRTHNAIKTPFLHEAAGHLLGRNVNLARAGDTTAPGEQRSAYTTAWHENRILETYFPAFLQTSRQWWSTQTRSAVQLKADPDAGYESRIASYMITAYTRSQAEWFSLSALIVLLGLGHWARVRARRFRP